MLASSGCWVGAAESLWPPLGAAGFSCQDSPSSMTTFFFSSKPATDLKKNECPYGVNIVGLVLAHPMHTDVTFCGHSRLLSLKVGQRGAQHGLHIGEKPVSSSGGPQHYYSLPTKAIPTCTILSLLCFCHTPNSAVPGMNSLGGLPSSLASHHTNTCTFHHHLILRCFHWLYFLSWCLLQNLYPE